MATSNQPNQKSGKQIWSESALESIEKEWNERKLVPQKLKIADFELLILEFDGGSKSLMEEQLVQLESLSSSSLREKLGARLQKAREQLIQIRQTQKLLSDAQNLRHKLLPIYSGRKEVKSLNPEAAKQFKATNAELNQILASKELKIAGFVSQNRESLAKICAEFQIAHKALDDLLAQKRHNFPRFYFISSTILLKFLANSSNPESLFTKEGELSKILGGAKNLELVPFINLPEERQKELEGSEGAGRPQAVGIAALEGGEILKLKNGGVPLVGSIENYLPAVIESAQQTLKDLAVEEIEKVPSSSEELLPWLTKLPNQITQLLLQTIWCSKVEAALTQEQSTSQLEEMASKLEALLQELVELLGANSTPELRTKLSNVVVLISHQKEITNSLYKNLQREKVSGAQNWNWLIKLRTVFENGDFSLKSLDWSNSYGFEYQGNAKRLVITPQTDKFYVAACQALKNGRGFAPTGPAGTGKTETIKDLANQCGRSTIIINCSPELRSDNLRAISLGIASSGAWGVFDEFNRVSIEVISTFATQVAHIFHAAQTEQNKFLLSGIEGNLNPSAHFFLTLNKGYVGSGELPDQLKVSFRQFGMQIPDLTYIAQYLLRLQGINDPSLSQKLIYLFTRAKKLLSKQQHYEWGLRKIKRIIEAIGAERRASPELGDSRAVAAALQQLAVAKLVPEDLALFKALIAKIFKEEESEIFGFSNKDEKFAKDFEEYYKELSIKKDDTLTERIVRLNSSLETSSSVLVLGPAGCGKTNAITTLAVYLKANFERIYIKAYNSKELFGYFSKEKNWVDGIFTKALRQASKSSDPTWIILDGPLDPILAENFNPVLDNNKVLLLANGERVPLASNVRILFETDSVAYITPAFLSRVDVLSFQPASLNLRLKLVENWVDSFIKRIFDRKEDVPNFGEEQAAKVRSTILQTVDKVIPKVQSWLRNECKLPIEINLVGLTKCFATLIEARVMFHLNHIFGLGDVEWTIAEGRLLQIMGVSLLWSHGGVLTKIDGENFREKFSLWFRENFRSIFPFPEEGSIFDWWVIYYEGDEEPHYVTWKHNYQEPVFDPRENFVDIAVTFPEALGERTVARWLQESHLDITQTETLLLGGPRCGRRSLTRGLVTELRSDRKLPAYGGQIAFHHYTTATSFVRGFRQALDPIEQGYSARSAEGREKMVFYIEDLNLGKIDKFSANTALELLREVQETGEFVEDGVSKKLEGVTFNGSMNPAVGYKITERYLRHLHPLSIEEPSQGEVEKFFTQYLNWHFERDFDSKTFSEEVKATAKGIAQAATGAYYKVIEGAEEAQEGLRLGIRDLKLVFSKFEQTTPKFFQKSQQIAELLISEVSRVLGSRSQNFSQSQTIQTSIINLTKQKIENFDFSKENSQFFYITDTSPQNLKETNPEAVVVSNTTQKSVWKPPIQKLSYEEAKIRLETEITDSGAKFPIPLVSQTVLEALQTSQTASSTSGSLLVLTEDVPTTVSLAKLGSSLNGCAVVGSGLSGPYYSEGLHRAIKELYIQAAEGREFNLVLSDKKTDKAVLSFLSEHLTSSGSRDIFNRKELINLAQKVSDRDQAGYTAEQWPAAQEYLFSIIKRNIKIVFCINPAYSSISSLYSQFPTIFTDSTILHSQTWTNPSMLEIASSYLQDTNLRCGAATKEEALRLLPTIFNSAKLLAMELKAQSGPEIKFTSKLYISFVEEFKERLAAHRAALKAPKELYKKAIKNIENELNNKESLKEKFAEGEFDRAVSILQKEIENLTPEIQRLEMELGTSFGDSLVSAAGVVLAGGFTSKLRRTLLQNSIIPSLKNSQIPTKENINFITSLVKEQQLVSWELLGLAADQGSIQDVAILESSTRITLLIDPQQLGAAWLRRSQAGRILVVDGDFAGLAGAVEVAMQTGTHVLIQNLGQRLPSAVSALIGRYAAHPGRGAGIYLQCVHPRPSLAPEEQSIVNLVNFTVSKEDAIEQLSVFISSREKPKISVKRSELTRAQVEDWGKFDTIVSAASSIFEEQETGLLENQQLLALLEEGDQLFGTLMEREATLQSLRVSLREVGAYKRAAERGALIFDLARSFSPLGGFFSVSFAKIASIVGNAIDHVEKSLGPVDEASGVEERVEALVEGITREAHSIISISLFKREKMLFSEMLAIKILEEKERQKQRAQLKKDERETQNEEEDPNSLDLFVQEKEFLIKGPQNSKKIDFPKELQNFITPEAYQALSEAQRFEGLGGIAKSLVEDKSSWEAWIQSEQPEKENLPQKYLEINFLQRLILIRYLRPERQLRAARELVKQALGEEYHAALGFSPEQILGMTNNRSVVIYALGENTRATNRVIELFFTAHSASSDEERSKLLEEKLVMMVLGEGNLRQADMQFRAAIKEGRWIFLRGLHLVPSFFRVLNQRLEEARRESHQNFRIFISTRPFESSTLQSMLSRSLMIAIEAPKSKKQILRRCWAHITPQRIEKSSNPENFLKLAYNLCQLHAILSRRNSYPGAGYENDYCLADWDLSPALAALARVLSRYDGNINKSCLDELKYLLSSVYYGGLYSRQPNREAVGLLFEQLFSEDSLESSAGSFEELTKKIEELPKEESPNDVYLGNWAEARFAQSKANLLLRKVAKRTTTQQQPLHFSDENLEGNFNIENLKEKINSLEKSDLRHYVMLREAERLNLIFGIYNKLVQRARELLKRNRRKSDELDPILRNLTGNRVPEQIQRIDPTRKNLSGWVLLQRDRRAQIEAWAKELQLPNSIDLSLLTNPAGYISAVAQSLTQENGTTQEIAEAVLELTEWESLEQIEEKASECEFFVHGVLLEGALAKQEAGITNLEEREARLAISKLPILRIVTKDQNSDEGRIEVPIYLNSERSENNAVTNLSLKLKDGENGRIWLLRGIAGLLSADF